MSDPAIALVLGILALVAPAGCGASEEGGIGGPNGGEIDPTPEKENEEPSEEFEPDDIERAEEAPRSVREYLRFRRRQPR